MISNHCLAQDLGKVNKVVALLIVLGWVYVGWTFGGLTIAALGFFVGYLVAVLMCGVVAVLVSMAAFMQEMVGIARRLEEHAQVGRVSPVEVL